MTMAERKSNTRLTKDTSYLTLWASYGVSSVRILEKNSPRFNGIALYITLNSVLIPLTEEECLWSFLQTAQANALQ